MSARSDTWMPLYWGDYARDTGHLNATGHGCYLLLIKHYWCSGYPLHDNDDELWRIACCDNKRQWLAVKGGVVRLFQEDGGFLRHKRVDAELRKAAERVEIKAKAGKKGAEARWQPHSNRIADASQPHASANGKRMAAEWQPHGFANAQSQSQELVPALIPQSPRVRTPESKRTFAGLEEHVSMDTNGRRLVRGEYLDSAMERICDAARINTAAWAGNERPLIKWLADGYEPEPIVEVVRRIADRPGYQPPSTLAYFDKPVRQAPPTSEYNPLP